MLFSNSEQTFLSLYKRYLFKVNNCCCSALLAHFKHFCPYWMCFIVHQNAPGRRNLMPFWCRSHQLQTHSSQRRSIRSQMFYKFLVKFTQKAPALVSLFNKIAGLKLFWRRFKITVLTPAKVFSCYFCKKHLFNNSGRLLLTTFFNYFRRKLHLRCLTGFWIRLSLLMWCRI